MSFQHSNTTLVCTASGTFLSVLPNLHSEDVLKTIILATLGAIVSFIISLLLKFLIKKQKNKFSSSCGDLWTKRKEIPNRKEWDFLV